MALSADPFASGWRGSEVLFPAALQAGMQNRAGAALYTAGDLPTAGDAFETCLRLHQEAGPGGFGPEEAAAWNGLALVHLALDRYALAEGCLQKALKSLERHDRQGTPEAIAVWNNLGCLEYQRGNFAQAEQWHRRAVEQRQQLGPADHGALAEAERNLALSAMAAGHAVGAVRTFHQALRRCDALGEAWWPKSMEILLCLAKVHDQQGEFGDAEAILIEAFNRHESHRGSNEALTAHLLNGLGCLYAKRGYFREARRMFQKSMALRNSLAVRPFTDLAVSYANLGVVELALGGKRQAEVFFDRARRRFADAGFPFALGFTELPALQHRLQEAESPDPAIPIGPRLFGSPGAYVPLEQSNLLIQGTSP